MSPTLHLLDATTHTWRTFTRPVRVLEIHTLADILPALHEIDRAVTQNGLWAAGFLAYEAAPAFDPAMVTHPPVEGLPLMWFGLYELPIVNSQFPIPNSQWIIDNSQLAISPSPSAYHTALAHIKAHIAAGNTYQVNYTLRLRAPLPHISSSPLLPLPPPPYAAHLDLGRFVISSASPELFFDLNGHTLRSKPMKGTAPRGRTLPEDHANAEWLYHSEKNRAENVMIVDMVRNDMGRIATTGTVRVPHLFDIERYPTVLQMTSTVECETLATLPDIFTALFPCASITGAPKIRTMQIIRELEPDPRGVYTGAIGFIAPGNAVAPGRRAQFNVAIRTLVVDTHTGQAEYGTGGGIVWDSDPEDEYREAHLKTRVLTVRRPTFDLLESLRWTPDEGYLLLERHLARLRDSAEYFDFLFDEERIRTALDEHAPSLSTPHKVRILLTRAGEVTLEHQPLPPTPFLLFPPASLHPASFDYGVPLPKASGHSSAQDAPPAPGLPLPKTSAQSSAQNAALRVSFAPAPVSSSDVFLFHKTTHRAVYEQARAACPGYDEVLLWNERGEVTEFTTSNVVMQIGGDWFTPPVGCGLLGGTLRGGLIEQGTVSERVILREQVAGAEAVWAVNSVRGWRQVSFA